jgi:phage gp46-like protein
VTESLVTDNNCRQGQAWWSENIAVGSDFFVGKSEKNLGYTPKIGELKKSAKVF